MFGVAQQKLEFITHKKRNWIQQQSVVSSLIIQKNKAEQDGEMDTIAQALAMIDDLSEDEVKALLEKQDD